MPVITLPDGSKREYPQPLTVAEVAASIGAGLAKAALAGRVDGVLVDTSFPIERDVQLAIVTDKDADGLDIIRHSTSHLMAYAVKEMFPEAQVTIGPVIENGFYYDFACKRPFTPEDLEAIEKRMAELAKKDFPVTREVWPRDKAVEFFKSIGEHYKAELIAAIPSAEDVSLYREGDFIDLCRGPHVPSTGKLKVFKLMKVAGAYWRGDQKNEQLQRIYGTAWAKKDELDAHLHMLEEAEKRDHRKLGRQLDLFHVQEEAPGMVFWHPHGWTVWQEVEQYMRRVYRDNGYQEVRCPQILDRSLWERSGHWEHFKQNMFTTESESRDYAVKPMNCPGHVQIFNTGVRSYRELPLRYGEFGSCHRNEPSGALHGVMRVRAFTQDDGHIFCTEDQIQSEVTAFNDLLRKVYADFGFTMWPSSSPCARRAGGRGPPVGQGRKCAAGGAHGQRIGLGGTARRGRLLRPQDRIPHQGCHRPLLAVRHGAGGFLHARTPRRRICRRGQQPPYAGDAAPGHPRFAGALHRHPGRKPCRRFPAVAGAGAGGGDEHLGSANGLRGKCGKNAARGRPARRERFARREN
jgi:threonyl-tRNA synthetase